MSSVSSAAYEQLFELLCVHGPLSMQERAACKAAFTACTDLAKGQVMEERDCIPKHLYYVHQGVLRLFDYTVQGEVHTAHLAGPGCFITPFLAFIHQRPTTHALSVVAPATVLRITHQEMKALIDAYPTFQRFSLTIFEQAMAQTQAHAQRLATLSAEAHYRFLLETQQPWLAMVPVQDIASYLGIKPQSLSRIRRQYASESPTDLA